MSYLTDRKRAQGLGSGRYGTHHHWQMMSSSVALVFLVPVFIITFGIGMGGTHEEVVAYFGKPFPAIVTALTLYVGITHLMNEALVAVEDYIHGVTGKLTQMAVRGFSYTLIAVGLFAIAKIAFTGV